jgi:hypothetical protein
MIKRLKKCKLLKITHAYSTVQLDIDCTLSSESVVYFDLLENGEVIKLSISSESPRLTKINIYNGVFLLSEEFSLSFEEIILDLLNTYLGKIDLNILFESINDLKILNTQSNNSFYIDNYNRTGIDLIVENLEEIKVINIYAYLNFNLYINLFTSNLESDKCTFNLIKNILELK